MWQLPARKQRHHSCCLCLCRAGCFTELLPEFGIMLTVLSSLSLWNIKQTNFIFAVFFFFYQCWFCMNQREVKCQQMRPVLLQHHYQTLTWRIAPLTPSLPLSFSVVSTWTINQTASCNWWQSVRNELLWLGLSWAGRHEAGRVQKSQREGRESVNADLNRIRGRDINIKTWRTVSGERHWRSQTCFKWTKGSVGFSVYFTENFC